MSSIAYRENFRPFTDVIPIVRRDIPPADTTLVNPLNPLSLIDGEWMTQDSNGKLIRPVDVVGGTPGTTAAGSVLVWPLWAENGRFDTQAMADRKLPLLWLNQYEFETRIFDSSATAGVNGAAVTTMHQPLKVALITISYFGATRNVSGLVGHGSSNDTDRIVGYVTRLPAANGGWLRFRGGMLF